MPISTRKIAQFTKKIADLADKPNLGSSSALKIYFDSSPEELRIALNGLIDDLSVVAAGSSGASNIGVSPISGLTGTDVQEVIENLHSALKSVASSSSGAHLIGSAPIPEVAGSTVYAQLLSIKTLIDLIFSKIISTTPGSSGSDLVGSAPIPGVAGVTVFAQLASIYSQLRDVVLNQIPNGTVTDDKLSNAAGQIKDRFAAHLADLATYAELQLSLSQSVPTGSGHTKIIFDKVVKASPGLFEPISNGVKVVKKGIYQVISQFAFSPNVTGFRDIVLYVNSTAVRSKRIAGSDSIHLSNSIVEFLDLNAGDIVYIYGTQTSGVSLDVSSSINSYLQLKKVG